LRYLIAFIVGCYGFTYIPFGILVPARLKEWKGSSWLLGNALTDNRRKALVLVLHVMAGIVILACAVAIAFARSAPGLWRRLAIAGGILSVAAFAVFFEGQMALFAQEEGIGRSRAVRL
jgi:hypothetical protein